MFRALALAVSVVALVPAAALASPEPGWWSRPPVKARGAWAAVSFAVDFGSVLVQPTVRYRLRRCGGRPWSETVRLGLVATVGRRFEVVARHRLARRRVKLRLVGRFDSEFEAHGVLRGRVAARGRRPACRIPRLRWTASHGAPAEETEGLDDVLEGEFDEDEEYIEDDFDDDGEPNEDGEDVPDEGDDPGIEP